METSEVQCAGQKKYWENMSLVVWHLALYQSGNLQQPSLISTAAQSCWGQRRLFAL